MSDQPEDGHLFAVEVILVPKDTLARLEPVLATLTELAEQELVADEGSRAILTGLGWTTRMLAWARLVDTATKGGQVTGVGHD